MKHSESLRLVKYRILEHERRIILYNCIVICHTHVFMKSFFTDKWASAVNRSYKNNGQ